MNLKNHPQQLKLSLLALLIGVLSLGQLQRWQLTNNIAVYVHELVMIGWLLLGLSQQQIRTKFINKLKTWFTSLGKLEQSWLIWLAFGLVINQIFYQVSLTAWLYLARLSFYLLFIAWLKTLQLSITFKKFQLNATQLGWLIFGLLTLLLGLLQYLFLPDTRFLAILGWDDHYYRLISTQFDPNFTGMILVITFIYLHQRKLPRAWQSAQTIMLSLLTIGLGLTLSRASYLSFALALLLLTITKLIDFRKSLAFGLILLITIGLAPKPTGEGVRLQRTSSIKARYASNSQTLQSLTTRQWLIGQGLFNTNQLNQPPSTKTIADHAQLPDNLLILIIQGTGLIGLVLLSLLTVKWTRGVFQKKPNFAIALTVTLLHSMFNNTLLQPFVLLMLLAGQ
ncbi:MAG: hypothetical protein GF390_03815 [Candidatus Pacebacteria bacterium]|nr:hypothetical protein [Candidatus Paceibacterota bacterium]